MYSRELDLKTATESIGNMIIKKGLSVNESIELLECIKNYLMNTKLRD